ncbi:MAG: ABC transporter ATP-binding protein [Deltaproteobacteria bacterium]|nr:ABC transporter ATP-binding protein [Deltaproteobacteria bacterium]MBW2154097.1 ABC transporter ATP-binding protein [Deltaproteobacteria bacterium]
MSLLKIDNVNACYGDVQVLHGVTLEVPEAEIVTIVGANGAGKSTLLKTIAGILRPTSGEIRFAGERLDHLDSHQIVERGLIRIPEGRKIFPSLTVLENLEMGSYLPKPKAKRAESLEKVFTLFPVLKDRCRQLAGTLSGGEQQMLAIGRGLMSLPRLLMLDEPSLGLAPLLVREIFLTVLNINKQGTTILLVEQNVFSALDMANEGYVLENGSIILHGKSQDLLRDDHIRTAYLGI